MESAVAVHAKGWASMKSAPG
jgi:hypothetical protein